MGDGRNCIQTKEKDGYFLQHRPFLIARKIFFVGYCYLFCDHLHLYIRAPEDKKGGQAKKVDRFGQLFLMGF